MRHGEDENVSEFASYQRQKTVLLELIKRAGECRLTDQEIGRWIGRKPETLKAWRKGDELSFYSPNELKRLCDRIKNLLEPAERAAASDEAKRPHFQQAAAMQEHIKQP